MNETCVNCRRFRKVKKEIDGITYRACICLKFYMNTKANKPGCPYWEGGKNGQDNKED